MIPQDGYPQKNNKHWWWCRNSSYTAAAKSLQSCPTLWDPIDLGSPPGSPVLQARTLEWVAISFSNACKWKVKAKSLSCVRLFATPWVTQLVSDKNRIWNLVHHPYPMPFSEQKTWNVRLDFYTCGFPDSWSRKAVIDNHSSRHSQVGSGAGYSWTNKMKLRHIVVQSCLVLLHRI